MIDKAIEALKNGEIILIYDSEMCIRDRYG